MDTKTVPEQPAVPLWGLNCLVVFQNIFSQYNPFCNTGSRRRSKNNLRGITMGMGLIWEITSLTFILSCCHISINSVLGAKPNFVVFVVFQFTLY